MKQEIQQLKKEEMSAWVETTRNVAKIEQENELEMSAMKKLISASHDPTSVNVQVVDRIQENYIQSLKDKMQKVKDMNDTRPSLQKVKDSKEDRQKNMTGVKAF